MVSSVKMRTLQEICLERVCRLLKKGTWNKCAINPFSSMPVKAADSLMAYLLSVPAFIGVRDMRPLLQSGQLSKFDMSTLLLDDHKALLPKWMTEDACKNLRNITLLNPLCGESGVPIITAILQRCHFLEELHSKLPIDLSALKNCHQLKNMRLHVKVPFNVIAEDFYLKIVDFVRSNPNLEVFAFCDLKDGSSATRALAAILENCPQIASVGFVDSLEALHHIRKTRGVTRRLNLRRCSWGINEDDSPSQIPKSAPYSEKYPEKILNAVNMCPNVEALVMNVYNELALEHLVHLVHLRSLTLKFNYKSADNVTSLHFFLRRVGPLLHHLALHVEEPIPVEIIRDHCFNLKTLQVYGSVVMNDDMESCLSPFPLERLYIWKADRKSLFFLMRNSPKLTEMYLGNVLCLEDELMKEILLGNFLFSKLIVVGIRDCLLSKTGIGMLLDSAFNLKELFFGTLEQYKNAHRLICDRRLKVLHYYETFKLKKPEFYVFRPNLCSF